MIKTKKFSTLPAKEKHQKSFDHQKEEFLKTINLCPDFDEDCPSVENPTDCFLGWMPCLKPFDINIGVAEGYCPFLKVK